MTGKYKTGAHTKHRLLFHLVFQPKYRKRVLQYDLAKRLKELFRQCSEVNGWEIHTREVMTDHLLIEKLFTIYKGI